MVNAELEAAAVGGLGPKLWLVLEPTGSFAALQRPEAYVRR
jgi:hypothetical protein